MTYEDAKRLLSRHSIALEFKAKYSDDFGFTKFERQDFKERAEAIRIILEQAERNS